MPRNRQSLALIVLITPIVVVIFYIVASIATPRSTTAQGSSANQENIADVHLVALTLPPDQAVELSSLNMLSTATPEPMVYATPTPVNPQMLVQVAQANTSLPTPSINPTYIVQRGDTLYTIAQRFNVSVANIAAASAIVNINQLTIGQVLIIPILTLTPSPVVATLNITPIALLTNSPTPIPPTPTDTPSPLPTNTPQPSNTSVPTDTAQPTATPMQSSTAEQTDLPFATNTPDPAIPIDDDSSLIPPLSTAVFISMPRGETTINELSLDDYLIMDDDTRQHVLEIYALGQSLGRNPHAFSKLGDSVIENPHFMDRFDEPGNYNLDIYSWLQPTIDWYRGSFSRDSVGVRVGIHSWSMFDPMWADPYECNSGETVIDCEIRLSNPSIMYIRVGSNDMGAQTMYEANIRLIIEHLLENGIIPILDTKADRNEGSNINNEILVRLAEEYAIPLWDFDALAGTIPGRGVGSDGYHMTTFYAHDWSQSAAFQTGHGVHSLAGLIVLDAVWRVIYGGE
jgi:LysM repeat protein